MAAPITHIVLATKVYDQIFVNFSKNNFLMGTSFPDIRYLKVIDRALTHFKDLSVKDIKDECSFMAGVKFHSIVDELRERYVVSHRIYEQIPQSQYITQSLKLFEDELFYKNFSGWNNLIRAFGQIPYAEIKFPVNRLSLDGWYSLLRDYFKEQPTPQSRRKFIQGVGFSLEDSQEMENIIDEIKDNLKIEEEIGKFYKKFGNLLR